jgi:hypothetical protein
MLSFIIQHSIIGIIQGIKLKFVPCVSDIKPALEDFCSLIIYLLPFLLNLLIAIPA